MKKLALALIAISAALFGFGMVAEAQTGPYGAGTGSIVFTPPNPGPGQVVTITITGCTPGEVLTVTITINGSVTVVGKVTCVAAPSQLSTGAVAGLLMPQQTGTGQATITFTTPTAPGTYTITATGNQGYSRSVTLVIPAQAVPPAGGLPATGSSGIDTTMMAAAGLFAVGLGLLGVTLIRRRQTPSPA